MKGNTAQLLALAVAALFVLPFSLAGLLGAFFLGNAVASGELETVVEWSRMGFVYGWIFVVAFGGYRAYAVALRPDNLDGLLSTVSHREVLGGLVLAELLLWTAFVLTAGFGAAVAFGIGAGSVLSIPFVMATLGLVLGTGLLAGFMLALAVRNTGVRSVLLTRLRLLFFAVLGLGYFLVLVTNAFASVLEPVYRLLAPTPVAWFGDLASFGLGVDASPIRAIGAVFFAGLFVAGSVPLLARLAEWLWYADGVHVDHEVDHSTDRSSHLSGVLSAPVLAVVIADWKRARRAPISLSFVLYPMIFLIGPIITTFETGTVGSSLPLWILLCGVWIAGSLFTLNVLGHEGAVLPATLLAENSGRALVIGHVLAGALVSTPLTVLAILITGVLSPHSLPMVASLAVSGLILPVAASAIATGIGVRFPRFDAVRVSRSTKAVVPSLVAFTAYSIVLLAISLPTITGHSILVGQALASWFGVAQISIALAGTLGSGIFAIGIGLISIYSALNRLDGYQLD